MKNRSRLLLAAAAIALAAWLVFIGLFLHLSSYNPYSWAFPGIESDLSRSLYLSRRNLYMNLGVASFVLALVSGLVGLMTKRISSD
jgi:hypothetical protein